MEDDSQTILRFNILTTWHSVNSMDAKVKDEFLQTLDFDHFTTKQLASEVKKSGLYEAAKIIERMDQLFEMKEQMEDGVRTENDQLKNDISIIKRRLNKMFRRSLDCSHHRMFCYCSVNPWLEFIDEYVQSKYKDL